MPRFSDVTIRNYLGYRLGIFFFNQYTSLFRHEWFIYGRLFDASE